MRPMNSAKVCATRDAAVEVLDHARHDFTWFAEHFLTIQTKAGQAAPLRLNRAQQYIHEQIEAQKRETGKVRVIIVKGRQQGCSTYVQARYFHRVMMNEGVQAFILTHQSESTKALFGMTERFYGNLPPPFMPRIGKRNQRELQFDRLNSGYRVGTAGNDTVGRGTTFQLFHGSEVGHWQERNAAELVAGILQAVPDAPGTEIILESTANGVGNFFHSQTQQALRSESDFRVIFVPWYWQPEYRRDAGSDFAPTDEEEELKRHFELSNDQLAWRRNKIREMTTNLVNGEQRFHQEYPNTLQEAFVVSGDGGLISPRVVLKARKTEAQTTGPLIVGVDPSRGGDRFAVIRRQGRRLFNPETHVGDIDLRRAEAICLKILTDENPQRMFIDAAAGYLVDRLRDLGFGHIVTPVEFGATALAPERYANRRAEMWGEMAHWLQDSELPVDIPDSDELHTDLCAPRYSFDTKDRLKLEPKDRMKQRGLPSPDLGDAAALTFAEPVYDPGAPGQSFEPEPEPDH